MPPIRRGDPAGHLAGLGDPLHQALDEGAVGFGRKPSPCRAAPFLGGDRPAVGIDAACRPRRRLRGGSAGSAGAGDNHARRSSISRFQRSHRILAIVDIGAARHLVHRVAQRHLLARSRPLPSGNSTIRRLVDRAMVGEPALVGPALDAGGEIGGGVRRDFRAEQIERRAEPEIDIALHGRQIDRAGAADRGRDRRCRARFITSSVRRITRAMPVSPTNM